MKSVLAYFVERVVQEEECLQSTKTQTRMKEAPDKIAESIYRMSKSRSDVGRETPDRSFLYPRSI